MADKDIVERLRAEVSWESDVGDILAEAAGEIEKLRRRVRLADAALRSEPALTEDELVSIKWIENWLLEEGFTEKAAWLRSAISRLTGVKL